MSAYTSAECYRAGGEPPVVTPQDLAHFTERILALDILDNNTIDVKLKFGAAIDQDDRPIFEEKEVMECLYHIEEIDWDVSAYHMPTIKALHLLQHSPSSRTITRRRKHVTEHFQPNIYRAYLSFGMLKEEVYAPLSHEVDGHNLYLSDLSFSIEVVEISDPQKPDRYHVGWMAFAVHANGYLFPWTYEETLEKLRCHPVLHQIRDLCRELWPATTTPPDPEIIAARPQLGKLWAEPLDAPYDWYWAINESY